MDLNWNWSIRAVFQVGNFDECLGAIQKIAERVEDDSDARRAFQVRLVIEEALLGWICETSVPRAAKHVRFRRAPFEFNYRDDRFRVAIGALSIEREFE